MRKILLTVVTGAAISLVGVADLQAAPLRIAGFGSVSEFAITKVFHNRYGRACRTCARNGHYLYRSRGS
jgi:hypothetical protein